MPTPNQQLINRIHAIAAQLDMARDDADSDYLSEAIGHAEIALGLLKTAIVEANNANG